MENTGAWSALLPFLLVLVLGWLLLVRPQQIQMRRRQEMLAKLRPGDRIVTLGGIYGTVTAVEQDTVRVKIAEGVEITLSKSGVGAVLEKAE